MHKLVSVVISLFAAAVCFTACSNIDCPLDNVVRMQVGIYSYETRSALTLTDHLSVTPAGRDTLLLHFSNSEGLAAQDTLFITHKPQPHFESLDCPCSVFQTITAVRATSHPLSEMPLTVDSVSLVRSIVNYDDVENVRIFLRSTTRK